MDKIYQKMIPSVKNAAKSKIGGFTLIELLVVVLIIGILSAIALPQYHKAVAKSRISEGIIQARALLEAQNRYKMQTGEPWSNDLSALDIQLSDKWKCSTLSDYCYFNVNLSKATIETNRYNSDRLTIFCLAPLDNQLANEVCRSVSDGTVDHASDTTNYYLIYDPKGS